MSFFLATTGASLFAQDILLSDFEQSNYAWLPGGVWSATGTCFGPGPAHGTLANQNPVDGFIGNGLVNTYLNGDTSTGALTSPAFTIQRNYIKFLIGGGNHLAQTCMNLVVGGQVRRRLLKVRGAGEIPPRPTALFQGDRRVGELRSAVRDGAEWIGLAMISLVQLRREDGLSLEAGGAAAVIFSDPA